MAKKKVKIDFGGDIDSFVNSGSPKVLYYTVRRSKS